jgi:hypothetical protein
VSVSESDKHTKLTSYNCNLLPKNNYSFAFFKFSHFAEVFLAKSLNVLKSTLFYSHCIFLALKNPFNTFPHIHIAFFLALKNPFNTIPHLKARVHIHSTSFSS